MTIIEVSIDLSAGTAQVSGPISNADNVQLVLKDYAENITDGSRVRIVRGCRELITGGTVTVSGDNGVCLLNTNSDEVKKLAESMRCPSQVGVEIVVDDTEDESVKASGRALLLLNWVEVGWSGGGGGGTVQDGAVQITNIDELPSRYRESDVRNKINEIARVISGRAVLLTAILAPFALFGVGVNVYTAQKDQVWNDERIVTNVTFDAEGLVTSIEAATNYVDSATNELSASLSEKISDSSESATNYTDSSVADLYESFSDKIVEISSESKSYTDTATNALTAKIPVVDLAPYATKTWVQSQGYLDSGSVDGVATKEWVSQQDFLTTLALTPYATIEWVIGRGYATPSVTNGLASMKWVEAKDYAAKSWVDGKGYATPSVTNGLAGESWVMSRGFVTKSVTNGLATRTWVEQKDYATEKWVNDKGYVTKSVTNGLAGKTWVTSQGYVTKSITNGLAAKTWVEQKGYLPSESAKRTYATKSELDALKRMYADTNGVTRIWSEDGLTMTDGTGVVWNITWNVVTNWTSLSNGVVFAQFYDESMDYTKWVSQGIYTNAAGKSSSAAIEISSGIFSVWLDAHAGSTGTFDISDGQILVEAHDYGYNDTFINSTVRVPAFACRSMVVTNTVGYVDNGTITDGTNTITAAGAATSAGIGKGYWMVRLIPDGAWLKLVPVPESGTAWWHDGATNSYVYDDSSLPGGQDGMWKVSVDDASHTLHIPAERYEAFSDSNAEGYYVPDRKTLATVDQIPTTPEQVGAAPASLAETVNAWQTYWDGDDVRITVTNVNITGRSE